MRTFCRTARCLSGHRTTSGIVHRFGILLPGFLRLHPKRATTFSAPATPIWRMEGFSYRGGRSEPYSTESRTLRFMTRSPPHGVVFLTCMLLAGIRRIRHWPTAMCSSPRDRPIQPEELVLCRRYGRLHPELGRTLALPS